MKSTPARPPAHYSSPRAGRPGPSSRAMALGLALLSLAITLVVAPPSDLTACLTDAPGLYDLQPTSFSLMQGLLTSLRDRVAHQEPPALRDTSTWRYLSFLWRFWYVAATALFALATLRLIRWRPRLAAPGLILILVSMALDGAPTYPTLGSLVFLLGLLLLALGALWTLATMLGFGLRASTAEDLPLLDGLTGDEASGTLLAAAGRARRALVVLLLPALPLAAALVAELATDEAGIAWTIPLVVSGLAGVAGVAWSAVALVAGPPDGGGNPFGPSALVPSGLPLTGGAVVLPLVAWVLAFHEHLWGATGLRMPLMVIHGMPLAFLAGTLLLPALVLPVVAARVGSTGSDQGCRNRHPTP